MKKLTYLTVFFFKLFLFSLLVKCAQAEEDQMKTIAKLRSKLLNDNKYDRLSKPVKDHKTKIQLFMMIHLFQIVDLSSSGILKTNLLVMSSWDDEHLVWNLSDHNNIDTVRFGHYEIWKPDLCVWNYDKGNAWDAFEDNDLLVDFNGTVNWDSLTHSITYCPLDLSEYPFDVQKCSVKIGPWMYTAKDVNLTSSKTFDGPFYSNGEWSVIKKEAKVIGDKLFTYINLKLTLQRRTTIYTYFIVFPYILSVLFILTIMIVRLDTHKKHLFAGCSIFIQLSLIMFIVSHIEFWTAKPPRSVRCMAINILFAICTITITTLLSIKDEQMKSRRLPLFIDTLLTNDLIGKIFILSLDSSSKDSNLMPFINEEETATNDSSIEIQTDSELNSNLNDEQPHSNLSPNILILESGLNEGEIFNLKRWFLFRLFIDRLTLYIYVVVLVTFHI